jgi:type II secretory pathway component PulF
MSSLLSSGVDMVVATQITGDVLQNSYYKDVLKEAEQIIQKGEPLHALFSKNEKLYPPFVNEMMAVGEETGQLAKMLMGVATFYEGEVEQKTKNMSTIIEPILMLLVGIGVGFFAISMISPMYSLVEHI